MPGKPRTKSQDSARSCRFTRDGEGVIPTRAYVSPYDLGTKRSAALRERDASFEYVCTC